MSSATSRARSTSSAKDNPFHGSIRFVVIESPLPDPSSLRAPQPTAMTVPERPASSGWPPYDPRRINVTFRELSEPRALETRSDRQQASGGCELANYLAAATMDELLDLRVAYAAL